jgi:CheY-like chemotaxis protein
MPLRCLLVDDSPHFLEAASRLLEGQGISIVGVASTTAEASMRIRELEPDVAIVDIHLNGESGFDLAWQLAASTTTHTVLTSTRSESDFAELVAVTPALGFVSKNELSADAVHDFVADRSHGGGCRHEGLIYSSSDELVEGTLPYLRQGLASGEQVLVVLGDPARLAIQDALGEDAARVEFTAADAWYLSPEHALGGYTRYVDDHLGRGASRVRILAEIVWPESSATVDVAAWKRYEASISGAMASLPVSFICAYDTRKLPAEIVTDAQCTHPIMRSAEGARASARYTSPGTFVRALERDVPELLQRP